MVAGLILHVNVSMFVRVSMPMTMTMTVVVTMPMLVCIPMGVLVIMMIRVRIPISPTFRIKPCLYGCDLSAELFKHRADHRVMPDTQAQTEQSNEAVT